jgi:dolichol-phosphate mannosyltransferase
MTNLDIIIPVFNEGKSIRTLLDSLAMHVRTPIRVLVCYDHDGDTTLPFLKKKYPFPVLPVKNTGKGVHGAIMTGFARSRASAVLVMPADDTHNARIIDTLYKKFIEGYAIVAPSRFIPGGNMVGCRWQKAILVRTVSFTLHAFTGFPIHDATNGFRLYSRRILTKYPVESTMGFVSSLELTAKAHRGGELITEIPAVWFERTGSKGRFRILEWAPDYLKWYFYIFQTKYFLY